MSSKNNLINNTYKYAVLNMAKKYKKTVIGLIVNTLVVNDLICFKPGINLSSKSDSYDQTYSDTSGNFDIFIVGRGIYLSDDIEKSVQLYISKMSEIGRAHV